MLRGRAEVPPPYMRTCKRRVAREVERLAALFSRERGGPSSIHTRRHDDRELLVLLLDGKTFADDQVVIALGVTTDRENVSWASFKRRPK